MFSPFILTSEELTTAANINPSRSTSEEIASSANATSNHVYTGRCIRKSTGVKKNTGYLRSSSDYCWDNQRRQICLDLFRLKWTIFTFESFISSGNYTWFALVVINITHLQKSSTEWVTNDKQNLIEVLPFSEQKSENFTTATSSSLCSIRLRNGISLCYSIHSWHVKRS